MIVLTGGNGAADHKDEGKILEFLNKLQEDIIEYKVRVHYALTDSEQSNVEFTYTDEAGKPNYRQKVIK